MRTAACGSYIPEPLAEVPFQSQKRENARQEPHRSIIRRWAP